MTAYLCSTLRSVASSRRLPAVAELRSRPLVQSIDLALVGSATTVAVALASAVAVAVLGGA